MVEGFAEKLNLILQQLEKRFGAVSLFAVLKMDDITDKWSIIIGASWADEKGQEPFNFVIDLLRKHLNQEERFSIARIGVLSAQAHLVDLMLQEFTSEQVINGDRKINGNVIHEGYILKAVPTKSGS